MNTSVSDTLHFDPDPDDKRYNTHNEVFLGNLWAYSSWVLNKKWFLKKKYILIICGFLCVFITIFFCYPDPRFLKWIRIRNTNERTWIFITTFKKYAIYYLSIEKKCNLPKASLKILYSQLNLYYMYDWFVLYSCTVSAIDLYYPGWVGSGARHAVACCPTPDWKVKLDFCVF